MVHRDVIVQTNGYVGVLFIMSSSVKSKILSLEYSINNYKEGR